MGRGYEKNGILMERGKTGLPAIVVLSQSEWGLSWVFAHDLARHFTLRGHTVVFLNPFPKRFPRIREWRRLAGRLIDRPELSRFAEHSKPDCLKVLTPLTLPDRNPFFTWINRTFLLPGLKKRILKACRGNGEIFAFLFLPFATPMALAGMLKPTRLIYAMRDGYEDDPRLSRLDNRKNELLEKAEMVLAAGGILAERSRKLNPRVIDIPGLVDFEMFSRPFSDSPTQDPLCCYFGHVNERVDLPLLLKIGRRFRTRIIGMISVKWPEENEIECLGMVPYRRVPELLSDADVVVIPYRVAGFSRSIFPYKIFQAFAQGKPVVATRLPALEPLAHLIYLAGTDEEFLEAVAKAGMEGPEIKHQRQETARKYDRDPLLESLRRRLLEE